MRHRSSSKKPSSCGRRARALHSITFPYLTAGSCPSCRLGGTSLYSQRSSCTYTLHSSSSSSMSSIHQFDSNSSHLHSFPATSTPASPSSSQYSRTNSALRLPSHLSVLPHSAPPSLHPCLTNTNPFWKDVRSWGCPHAFTHLLPPGSTVTNWVTHRKKRDMFRAVIFKFKQHPQLQVTPLHPAPGPVTSRPPAAAAHRHWHTAYC
jgi:hypothetical protein